MEHSQEQVIDYGDGIHAIDTGLLRHHFDASYLIVENGRAAFVDTGTALAVPRLLEALESRGLSVKAVDWVILTHVHLDHAGGAGALMQHLPNAQLVVHPRGARHMIDPTALTAGATAVYGEAAMRETYGELVPVPADRVIEAPDGHVVELAGRRIVCLDTPGHARHHNCMFDARSRAVFAGDTFGISYRETDCADGAFVIPTTSPVQFDPDALKASIARLVGLSAEAVYLTHFGRVDCVEARSRELMEQIDEMVKLAHDSHGQPDRHAWLVERLGALYAIRAARRHCPLPAATVIELLSLDIELNAQGLEVWLDRQHGARER
ncbi:MBL fold metallo-hydrolase [Uliginosibacterium sp. sgz301328]|uniref:MBL fold metallo-hydrolase n=1 Tax=Uliginosibacterium sp. sgz301328 TaxID=3243764 RepID=UPI00359D2B3B